MLSIPSSMLPRSGNMRREVSEHVVARSIRLFALSYIGMTISLFPMIVPHHFTLMQAASPPGTFLADDRRIDHRLAARETHHIRGCLQLMRMIAEARPKWHANRVEARK